MVLRKGIVFTTDAAVGLALVLIIILFFANLEFTSILPEKAYEKVNFLAEDTANLLSYLRVRDVQNKPTIADLIDKGVLKEDDLNETVLDVIGSFWYNGNESVARNIARDILENLTSGFCINLTTDGGTIYSSCNTPSRNIAIRGKIASGYQVGKPVSGYIARAWATRVKKNTTMVIPFLPEGSGWTANRLEVTKKFSLPTDISILNATLYVSVHFGTDKTQAQFENLKVNGVQKKNDVVWLYLEETGWGSEKTTAAYGYVDVKNEIIAGNNTIYLSIGTPKYHSHIHPGMRLVVVYNMTQELSEANKTFKKRYYFDDVVGRTGSWATLSFFIPPEAKNANATLHLKALRVDDTRDIFGRNSSDVLMYLNSDTIYFKDGYCNSTTTCYPWCSWSNYYYSCTKLGEMNPEYYFNITSKLVNGTNTLSVYLNSYADDHWGSQDSEIYSNPTDDPDGSSYVEVYYTLDKAPFGYGEIDITKDIQFGGNASNPKTFTFNLTESQSDIINSFSHIAQGFSSMLEVYAWADNNPWELVFKSPSVRAVPSTVYIRPNIWKVGNNSIRMRDFQPGGSTSTTNYILPWTSLEYTYTAKAIVGYGDVFNTSDLAINDSRQRLSDLMGSEGLTSQDIVIENKSVQGLRWLWGPSMFKILSWEK
jgi:hypothetical protein